MSSGFVTETELAEARKKKQEEWDRVRNAEDPKEAPEEPYDHRSLYERLQEQKQKRDLEYEEAHKLKNMIKGLDDDEIEFLDLVDRTKIAADRKKLLEDERELRDFRNRVATLQEQNLDQKLQAEVKPAKSKAALGSKLSQTKLLKGVIKKIEPKKRKTSDEEAETAELGDPKRAKTDEASSAKEEPGEAHGDAQIPAGNSELTCVAILPGLGCYHDSSSNDCSSDSELEDYEQKIDLLGRKIVKKET